MTNPSRPINLVIFGGTGDLSLRKLLPALYRLQKAQHLGAIARIVGTGRHALSDEDYRHLVERHLRTHIPPPQWSEESWQALLEKLVFCQVDAACDTDFAHLNTLLTADNTLNIFYLATLPSIYGEICRQLQQHGSCQGDSRVVLEKPIGTDLESCRRINREVGEVFAEHNTFRIDHYLGKETVQNVLVLRFGNTLFSPLWNNHYIDNVQITVAEDIGVEGRGSFYAQVGALRDMVQNHLLQVLCMVAMEPPHNLEADTIRDEKVKILQSLAPITVNDVKKFTVRGQYSSGAIDGEAVAGFRDEKGYEECHDTETFVGIRAQINNWRWAGVPFFLRTGKRMAKRYSEVAIEFRKQAFTLFPEDPNDQPNKLVIRLQPEENITLYALNKKPGLTRKLRLHQVALNLSTSVSQAEAKYEAYERLLLDVIAGDQTLFMRGDEVEAAWRWTDGIIAAWHEAGITPKPYSAGTMGPTAALALPERDGRSWHE